MIVFLGEVAPLIAAMLLGLTAIWLLACLRRRAWQIRVESGTVFRCTPEKVFALMADPRNEPRYRPEAERVELLSPGELAVGTMARGWVRIPRDSSNLGLYLVADEVITEFDPPRVVVTRIVGKSSQTRLTFVAVAEGTHVTAAYDSRIDFEEAVTSGLFFRGDAERRLAKSWKEAWERARVLLEEPTA